MTKEIIKFYWRAWNYRLLKERLEIKSLLKYINPGDSVIDIGAYKGAYTYWMAKAVGATGKAYAFEPQKYVYQSLLDIINKIKINNIILEPIGLSSKNGEMRLAIPGNEHSPGATFEIKENKKYKTTYNVQVRSLDSYFEKLHINKISFIKCDAEGHELEIFRGGVEILKKYKPVLLFECEQRHLREHKVQDVFTFLEQLGYQGQFIYQNKLHPLMEFQIDIHQAPNNKDYVNNFLFVATK